MFNETTNMSDLKRSVLDGYLTQGCKACIFWSDGNNELLKAAYSKLPGYGPDPGIGCCACFPIGDCPFFKAMERGIDLTKSS